MVAEGRRVGLLDADVYGPSQPRMLGVSGRPASPDGKTILPMRNHGVTATVNDHSGFNLTQL